MYNPFLESMTLAGSYEEVETGRFVTRLAPKQVVKVQLPIEHQPRAQEPTGQLTLLSEPQWRVGKNKG